MNGVAVPPLPRPEQLIDFSAQPAGGAASVTRVATPLAASVCTAPALAVPAASVLIECRVTPLVPLKPNVPTPPCDTLDTISVLRCVLVKVQTHCASVFMLAAGIVKAVPLPVMLALPVVALLVSVHT